MLRRSWVEVRLSAIGKNLQIYQSNLQPSAKVMAVVKADAYGHGAVEVANRLQEQGVTAFAVSNINEAIELRNAGIIGQILILGYTPVEEVGNLVKYDITQALLSEEYTTDLVSIGLSVKCQYAIDTGMNRISLDADDIIGCEKLIRIAAENLNLTGLFTHLCVADTPAEDSFTGDQIEKFKAVADSVKDLQLPYVHCLNSAGGLWHPTDISCFAWLGIILYGLKPDYMNTLPTGIEPAMEWKSVISMIKSVYPGETIGYGRTFKAEHERQIATIPTGYADGYNRVLSKYRICTH